MKQEELYSGKSEMLKPLAVNKKQAYKA